MKVIKRKTNNNRIGGKITGENVIGLSEEIMSLCGWRFKEE
jgi:hypothetical protein